MENPNLEIQRGQHLTIIKSGPSIRKLPTSRFDEIVGSSCEVLPESNPAPNDHSKRDTMPVGKGSLMDFNVKLNDIILSAKSLIEFADMSYSLLCTSLSEASMGFINPKYLEMLTRKYAEFAIINAAEIRADKGIEKYFQYSLFRHGLAKGKSIDLDIPCFQMLEQEIELGKYGQGNNGTVSSLDKAMKHSDETRAYLSGLVENYNSKIGKQKFIHKNGEELTIAGASYDEVYESYVLIGIDGFNKKSPQSCGFDNNSPIQLYAKIRILPGYPWIKMQDSKGNIKLELYANMLPKEVKDLLKTIGTNGVHSDLKKLYYPILENPVKISKPSPDDTNPFQF